MTAVVGAPQAFEQPVHGDVKGAVLVVGAGLGTDDRALDMTGDLDPVAGLGLATVGLVGHDHVEPLDAWRELRNLRQLVVQVLAESV